MVELTFYVTYRIDFFDLLTHKVHLFCAIGVLLSKFEKKIKCNVTLYQCTPRYQHKIL